MSHVRVNPSVVLSTQRTGKLDLHGKALYSLPPDVFERDVAPFVIVLDVSDNQLTELPSSLVKLTNLKELIVDGNRLRTLPVELVELRDLKAISMAVGNPNMDPKLKQLHDHAAPVFRTKGRDALPILAYLADQIQVPAGYKSKAPQALSPGSGEELRSPKGSYDDDRSPASDARSPKDGRGDYRSDDDYTYAQLRARAAARAAADAADRGDIEYRDERRDVRDERRDDRDGDRRDERYERDARDDRRDVRDERRDYGRDDRHDDDRDRRADRTRDGAPDDRPLSNSAGRQLPNAPFVPISQVPTRFSNTPTRRVFSPFARDDKLKMENREEVLKQQHEEALKHAEQLQATQLQKQQRERQELEQPRFGRRAFPHQPFNPPFGTSTEVTPAGSRHGSQAGSRTGSRTNTARAGARSPAPFGTDLNRDPPAAKRIPDPSIVSRSNLSNPYAAEDPNSRGGPIAAKTGVRMIHSQDPPRPSPYGLLPREVAGSAYQTSSGAAASHVLAAAQIRREGSLDAAAGVVSGPNSPTAVNQWDESGSKSLSGMRLYNKPSSDIFHVRQSEDSARRAAAAGGESASAASSSRGSSRGGDGRSNPRGANAGAAIMMAAERARPPPFARESDPPPTQHPGAGSGNRQNQSSLFDPQPSGRPHGRGQGANFAQKETKLW